MLSGLVVAVAGLVLSMSSVSRAADKGPVAVLPFQNLNQNPDSQWMSRGIAETLISDIRKYGKTTVVERDQLDRALTEVAFQQSKATDVSTATQIGRIVGARTVVVGSYQQAGQQLRITARFVIVETGVVQDTAKATGSVKEIFKLQDEVVARLLGRPIQRPPAKRVTSTKKPATAEKKVEAYRLYALSLNSATDAGRVKLLKKALEVDPDFVYAEDELAALERRMERYSALADEALNEQQKKLIADFRNPKLDTTKRMTAANNLLGSYYQKQRYRSLIGFATEVYEAEWPDDMVLDMHALALYWIFTAHLQLKENDQALQVGETYLKEFPTSPYYQTVEMQMQRTIDARRDREQAATDVAAELTDLDDDIMEEEYDLCVDIYAKYADWENAVKSCSAFMDKWIDELNDKNRYRFKRVLQAKVDALTELGRFDEAVLASKQIAQIDPETKTKISKGWPLSELPDAPKAIPERKLKKPIFITEFQRTHHYRDWAWIENLIPRVMSEDIERYGKDDVFSYEQIESSLEYLPWKDQRIHEKEPALEVGKKTGAAKVIYGEFTIEGSHKVSITARLVDVKSEKVQEATATGRMAEFLILTDQLLTELLGKDRYAAPEREVTKPGSEEESAIWKQIDKLSKNNTGRPSEYGQLLELTNEYPDFYYAQTELAKHQRRIDALAASAKQSRDAQRKAILAYIEFQTTPPRKDSVDDLLWSMKGMLFDAGYQRAALVLGETLAVSKWPDDMNEKAQNKGYYIWIESLLSLHRAKEAAEVLERYRKAYPTGRWITVASRNVERHQKTLARQVEKRKDIPERLARYQRNLVMIERRRCQILKQHQQYMQATQVCEAWIDAHKDEEEYAQTVLDVRWEVAQIYYERGDFEKAHELAEQLVKKYPDFARSRAIRTVSGLWPSEY